MLCVYEMVGRRQSCSYTMVLFDSNAMWTTRFDKRAGSTNGPVRQTGRFDERERHLLPQRRNPAASAEALCRGTAIRGAPISSGAGRGHRRECCPTDRRRQGYPEFKANSA
jgi:hypothetical protein